MAVDSYIDEDESITNEDSMDEVGLDLLSKIHDKLMDIDNRLTAIERRTDTLVRDLNIVHKFQQSFAERLYGVEKYCVEQPLRSVVQEEQAADGSGIR